MCIYKISRPRDGLVKLRKFTLKALYKNKKKKKISYDPDHWSNGTKWFLKFDLGKWTTNSLSFQLLKPLCGVTGILWCNSQIIRQGHLINLFVGHTWRAHHNRPNCSKSSILLVSALGQNFTRRDLGLSLDRSCVKYIIII